MEPDLPLLQFAFIRKASLKVNRTYLPSWILLLKRYYLYWQDSHEQPCLRPFVLWWVSPSSYYLGFSGPYVRPTVWTPLHKGHIFCSRLFSGSDYLWDWIFHGLSKQFVKVLTCCQDKNLYPHNQDFPCSTLCWLPFLSMKPLVEIWSHSSKIKLLS